MKKLEFSIAGRQGEARAASLSMARGSVATPVFMPVGTQGAIRATPMGAVEEAGVTIMLANTYHLSQRPGEKLIRKAGGLHRFMGTSRSILTDSGGFQVFSLVKAQVDDDGVTFAYPVDGRRTRLTPERSMEIQQDLGADIAMAFDECLPFGVDRARAERSLVRTHRWEERSRDAHDRGDQSLFGIVQGAFWPDLRKQSARAVASMGFDGMAIGGLAVGETPAAMLEMLEATVPWMPVDMPRYLMGVGRPQDLVEGVARGVDMFYCVIPPRHGRSGVAYTDAGRIRLSDKRFRLDRYPIDTSCDCAACTRVTRSYLHHLFKVGEILASTLTTIHNVRWFIRFMEKMRESILAGRFEEFRAWVLDRYPIHGGGPQSD